MNSTARAEHLFQDRFGVAPDGVWSAPGRVNLIGEHTDYNDGFVLPFALPLRTAVAAGAVRGDRWTVFSESAGDEVGFGPDDLVPGGVDNWAAYVAGVFWTLREAGFEPPPCRLAIASDLPLGAGLSSSAALECAVLNALVDVGGLGLPRDRWPRLAQRAENDYVGMPCGIMDQSAVTLCREGHALFLDCRDSSTEQIPFDLARLRLAMLVIDSRAPHQLVAGEYAARRKACEEAAKILGLAALRDLDAAALPDALQRLDEVTGRRVRHVVTENARVLETARLLRAGAVASIGPFLTESHHSMRDDYEITVPEVDTAFETALSAGAYGARMTGGGFGGCVLALVDADRVEPVAAAVAKAYAAAGFDPPNWFAATATSGVTREHS